VTLFSIYKRKFVIYPYSAIPAPYSSSRLRFFSSSFLDDLEDLWVFSAFLMNECFENLTWHLSDSTQKLKQFGLIVKFNTCITSSIFVKLSLKIKTARLQAILTIFPLDFDFEAIDQTNELKLSFKFYVYSLRHWFNKSLLLRSSHIDFVAYFLFYCSELLNSERRSDSLSA